MKTEIKNLLALVFVILHCGSCVLQSEHDVLVDENERLKLELEEIKFGLPKLVADMDRLEKMGAYEAAAEKAELLITKFPSTPEAEFASTKLVQYYEQINWEKARKQNSINGFEEYLNIYSSGQYAEEAKARIQQIELQEELEIFEKAKASDTEQAYKRYIKQYPNGQKVSTAKRALKTLTKRKEKEAYQFAVNQRRSSSWRKFLEDYPTHWNKAWIKDEIIRLEVAEILRNPGTGQIPSFNRTSYSSGSSAYVTIKNDTGYKLTVRYSGPSVKSITIQPRESITTTLRSGDYSVAATANGLHYGGKEILQGNYDVKYYISTQYR